MKRYLLQLADYWAKEAEFMFTHYPPDSMGWAKGELYLEFAELLAGIAEGFESE